ncbi:MAG: hypothetical protein ACD_80C00098G0005 [uncultured bacterium (gcode 4)]|uniref:Uncharacterized protein n=1 Tax=uncultured bacterium (gcode 4) TaxID=1234023 RepID=K1X510_9BACT|nr:MAG: hypothetical protein ACD_80C00098G0005 [uncultured bacterium (gcode 4)]
MQFHQHIIHHVRKHKEKIIAHVNRHHHKYIAWAGILWWMAIYKIIWLMVIFFGMAKMGWVTWADYYDAEFYATQEENKINIRNNVDTDDITNTTWCNITGNTLSWTTGNCPLITK